MKLKSSTKPGIAPLPPGMSQTNFYALVATWFGSGRLRPAPGTIGTLAAAPVGFLIAQCFGVYGLLAATIILMIIGTIAADKYGKASGEVDDQSIVVDEAVGLWIAALPAATNPVLWLIAVVLFRIFDVCKPWPASYFEKRSKNGFDTMMDDVMAGVYAQFGVSMAALLLLSNG